MFQYNKQLIFTSDTLFYHVIETTGSSLTSV